VKMPLQVNVCTDRRAKQSRAMQTSANKFDNANSAQRKEGQEFAKYLSDLSRNSPFNGQWKITETINAGTYGVVFCAKDSRGLETVIKVARSTYGANGNPVNAWEQFIVERIYTKNPTASVARLLDKGMLADKDGYGLEFMVLEKSQVNVKEWLYGQPDTRSRIRKTCQVALESLKALHDLHIQGLLHRDVKPDNMGILSRENPLLVLFDLGMARMYTDLYGQVRFPRTVVQFRGTPEYASGLAFKNREQNRMDDLISWFYVIIELFDPNPDNEAPLPWSAVNNTRAIRYLKSPFCPARYLLRHCPKSFYTINTYLFSVHHEAPPDYKFIAKCIVEARDSM